MVFLTSEAYNSASGHSRRKVFTILDPRELWLSDRIRIRIRIQSDPGERAGFSDEIWTLCNKVSGLNMGYFLYLASLSFGTYIFW
jgi:hypothetical protein